MEYRIDYAPSKTQRTNKKNYGHPIDKSKQPTSSLNQLFNLPPPPRQLLSNQAIESHIVLNDPQMDDMVRKSNLKNKSSLHEFLSDQQICPDVYDNRFNQKIEQHRENKFASRNSNAKNEFDHGDGGVSFPSYRPSFGHARDK
ncbi:Hypothetical_protein [Hexamita inflata]|uniref:Hypothetical_protein n=1 Tax=Hexamita inflata TaxID=28002 RepID=A0AA86PAG6_9EUKA|nr:Hypothetical protein HINF_LOCUS21670 [Hexamita inflata]CAI9935161.1 Hypothetical protein HINF_LOCUS22806 [Hexamita inflata]CAI9942593.1 Hypothetical protein HINF_LOCUS30238 [Hexamita inflata]